MSGLLSSDRRHIGLNLGQTDPEAHEAAEEVVFGFWVFLMSDMVLFALLFATYGTMLGSFAGGPGPHQLFDPKTTTIETTALLLSSFTFGMASLTLKYGKTQAPLLFWLGITLLLGLVFLGFEISDFISMTQKGGVPSRSGYISALFVLVATHGLHVTFGSLWIGVMMIQVLVFGRERIVKLRILRLGLFWHFLDIVWVCIFSVVYLQGLS